MQGPRERSAYDEHVRVRALDHLGAHGSVHEALERIQATVADDDQVGTPGGPVVHPPAFAVGLAIGLAPALGAPGPQLGFAVAVLVCQIVPFTVPRGSG